jgi:hypothetical protein
MRKGGKVSERTDEPLRSRKQVGNEKKKEAKDETEEKSSRVATFHSGGGPGGVAGFDEPTNHG